MRKSLDFLLQIKTLASDRVGFNYKIIGPGDASLFIIV